MADMDKNIFDWLFVRSYERRDGMGSQPSWKRAAQVVETTLISYHAIGASLVMLTLIVVWKTIISRRLKFINPVYGSKEFFRCHVRSLSNPQHQKQVPAKPTIESRKPQSPSITTRQQVHNITKQRGEKTGARQSVNTSKNGPGGRISTFGDQLLSLCKGRLHLDGKQRKEAVAVRTGGRLQKPENVEPSKVGGCRQIASKTETKTNSHIKIDTFNEVTCLEAEDMQDQLLFSKNLKTVMMRTERPTPKAELPPITSKPAQQSNEPLPTEAQYFVENKTKEETEVQARTCHDKIVRNRTEVNTKVPLTSSDKTSWTRQGSIKSGKCLEKSIHLNVTTDTSAVQVDDAVTDLMSGDFENICNKYTVKCSDDKSKCALECSKEPEETDKAGRAKFRDAEKPEGNTKQSKIQGRTTDWTSREKPGQGKKNVRKRSPSRLQSKRLGLHIPFRQSDPRLVRSSLTLPSSLDRTEWLLEKDKKESKPCVNEKPDEKLQFHASEAKEKPELLERKVQGRGKEVVCKGRQEDVVTETPKYSQLLILPLTGKRTKTRDNKDSFPIKVKKQERMDVMRYSPNKREIVAKIIGRLKVRKHLSRGERKAILETKQPLIGETMHSSITQKAVNRTGSDERQQLHHLSSNSKHCLGSKGITKSPSPVATDSVVWIINRKTKKEITVPAHCLKTVFSRSSSCLSKPELKDDNYFTASDSKKQYRYAPTEIKREKNYKTTVGDSKSNKRKCLNQQEPVESSKRERYHLSPPVVSPWIHQEQPVPSIAAGTKAEMEPKKIEKSVKISAGSKLNREFQLKGQEELVSQKTGKQTHLSLPPLEGATPLSEFQENLSICNMRIKGSLQEDTKDDLLSTTILNRKRIDLQRAEYPSRRSRPRASHQVFKPSHSVFKDAYTFFAHQLDNQKRQKPESRFTCQSFDTMEPRECQNVEGLYPEEMSLRIQSAENLKTDGNQSKTGEVGLIGPAKEIDQFRPCARKTTTLNGLTVANEKSAFRYEKKRENKVPDPLAPDLLPGYSCLLPDQGAPSHAADTKYQMLQNPRNLNEKLTEKCPQETPMATQQNFATSVAAKGKMTLSSKEPANKFPFPKPVGISEKFMKENLTLQPPKPGAVVEDIEQEPAFRKGGSELLPPILTLFKKTEKSSKPVEKIRRRELKGWSPVSGRDSVDKKYTNLVHESGIFKDDNRSHIHRIVASDSLSRQANICSDLATGIKCFNLLKEIPDHCQNTKNNRAPSDRGLLSVGRIYSSTAGHEDHQNGKQSWKNLDRDDTDTSKSKLLPKRSDIKSSEMTLRKISSNTGNSKTHKTKSKIPRYVITKVTRQTQSTARNISTENEETHKKNGKLKAETDCHNNTGNTRKLNNGNMNKHMVMRNKAFEDLALNHSKAKKNAFAITAKDRLMKKQQAYQISESSEDSSEAYPMGIMEANVKNLNGKRAALRNISLSPSISVQDESDVTSLFKNNLEESIVMIKPQRQTTLIPRGDKTSSHKIDIGPTAQSHKVTDHAMQLSEKTTFKRPRREAKLFQEDLREKSTLPFQMQKDERVYKKDSQQESSDETTDWSDSQSSVNGRKRKKLSSTHKDNGYGSEMSQKPFLLRYDSFEAPLKTRVDKRYNSKDKQETEMGGKRIGKSRHYFQKNYDKSLPPYSEDICKKEKYITNHEFEGSEIKTKRQMLQDILKKVHSNRIREKKKKAVSNHNLAIVKSLSLERKDKSDADTKKRYTESINLENGRDHVNSENLKTGFGNDHNKQFQRAAHSTKHYFQPSGDSQLSDRVYKTCDFSCDVSPGQNDVDRGKEKAKLPYYVIKFEDLSSSRVTLPTISHSTTKASQNKVDHQRHQQRRFARTLSHKSRVAINVTESPTSPEHESLLFEGKHESVNFREKASPKQIQAKTVISSQKTKGLFARERCVTKRPPKSPTLTPDCVRIEADAKHQQECLKFLTPVKKNGVCHEDGTKFRTKKAKGGKKSHSPIRCSYKYADEQTTVGQSITAMSVDRRNKLNTDKLLRGMKTDKNLSKTGKFSAQESPCRRNRNILAHTVRSKEAKSEVDTELQKIHHGVKLKNLSSLRSTMPTVTNRPDPGDGIPATSSEKRPSVSPPSSVRRRQLNNHSGSSWSITSPIVRHGNETNGPVQDISRFQKQKLFTDEQIQMFCSQEKTKPQQKCRSPIHRNAKTLQSPTSEKEQLTGKSKNGLVKADSIDGRHKIVHHPLGIVKTKTLLKTNDPILKTKYRAGNAKPLVKRNKELETEGASNRVLAEDKKFDRHQEDKKRTGKQEAKVGNRHKHTDIKDMPTGNTSTQHTSSPEQRYLQKSTKERSVEKSQANERNITTLQQKSPEHVPNHNVVGHWRCSEKAAGESDLKKGLLKTIEEEDFALPDHLPDKIRSNSDEYSSGSLQRLSPTTKRLGSPKQSKMIGSTSSPSNTWTKKGKVFELPTNVDALREKYLKEMKSKQPHGETQFKSNTQGHAKQCYRKLENRPLPIPAERERPLNRPYIPKTMIFQSKIDESSRKGLLAEEIAQKSTRKERQLGGLRGRSSDSTTSCVSHNNISHTTFRKVSGTKCDTQTLKSEITEACNIKRPPKASLKVRPTPTYGSVAQTTPLSVANKNVAATYSQPHRRAGEIRNVTYSVEEQKLRKLGNQSKEPLQSRAPHHLTNKTRDTRKAEADLQNVDNIDSLLKSISSHPKQTTGTYTIARNPPSPCSPTAYKDSSAGTGSWACHTSANLADSYSLDSAEVGKSRIDDITRDLLMFMETNSGTKSGLTMEGFGHSNADFNFKPGTNMRHCKDDLTFTQESKGDTIVTKFVGNKIKEPQQEQENSPSVSRQMSSAHSSGDVRVSWLGNTDKQDQAQDLCEKSLSKTSETFKGIDSEIDRLPTIWGFEGDDGAMTQLRKKNLLSLKEIGKNENKYTQPRVTRINKRTRKRKMKMETSQDAADSSKSETNGDKGQKKHVNTSKLLSTTTFENNVPGIFRDHDSLTVCLDVSGGLQNDRTSAAKKDENTHEGLQSSDSKNTNKGTSEERDLKRQAEVTRSSSGNEKAASRKINMRMKTDRNLYVTSALQYSKKKQQDQSDTLEAAPLGINNSAFLQNANRFPSRYFACNHFKATSMMNDLEKDCRYERSTENPISTATYFKDQHFPMAPMAIKNNNRHHTSSSRSPGPKIPRIEKSTPLSSKHYLLQNRCGESTTEILPTYSDSSTFESKSNQAPEDKTNYVERLDTIQREVHRNHRHDDSQDDDVLEKSEATTATAVPLNFDWYKPASTTRQFRNGNHQKPTRQLYTEAEGHSNRVVRDDLSEVTDRQSSGMIRDYLEGAVGGQVSDMTTDDSSTVKNGQLFNRTERPSPYLRDEVGGSKFADQHRRNPSAFLGPGMSSQSTFVGGGRRQMSASEEPVLSLPCGKFPRGLASTDMRSCLPRTEIMEDEINNRIPVYSGVNYDRVLPYDFSDQQTFSIQQNHWNNDATLLQCRNSDSNSHSQPQSFDLSISNVSTEYQNLQRTYNRANQFFHSNWLLANQNHSLNARITDNIDRINVDIRRNHRNGNERRHCCSQYQGHSIGNAATWHKLEDSSRALLFAQQFQDPFTNYSTTAQGENIPIKRQSFGHLPVNLSPVFGYPQTMPGLGEHNQNGWAVQDGTLASSTPFATSDTVSRNDVPIVPERLALQGNQISQSLLERNVPGCSCSCPRHEEPTTVHTRAQYAPTNPTVTQISKIDMVTSFDDQENLLNSSPAYVHTSM